MDIQKNIERIHTNIQHAAEHCGRNVSDITTVCVTKTVDVSVMQELLKFNVTHFGENRQQVMLPKYNELINENITWHFIGNLQTNKIRTLADKAHLFHSIIKESQLKELAKRCSRSVRVFIEVNTSGEESKHGISEDEVKPLVEKALEIPGIEVCGLMTMAPFVQDEKVIRDAFSQLRNLRDELCDSVSDKIVELSMGMSNDYEYAIKEGASILRIGSAFFA